MTNRSLRPSARAARRGVMLALVCAVGPAPLTGQDELDAAVEYARAAWLEHDAQALVRTSDTVRLQLPGVAQAHAVKPEQAARLLEQYLRMSQERTFELVEVRRLAPDHAYAQVARCYVVRGTTEERYETVFLGFRRVDDAWRLREVRVTP